MKIVDILMNRKRARNNYTENNRSFISRWARPPSMNTAEWLDMFSKSPRLAVVDRIASDIANVGGKLLRINADGTESEITNHPFLDFMKQPNPLYEMTSSAIWRLHEIYLLLVGESFFLIERNENGRPIELWNVPPHWVRTTPYLGNPAYQIISSNGLSMTVPVDDMFVMKQLNPLDPFMRGLGIAQSIADEVEIDEYAAKFQKRFFYNDATPPVVFIMPTASETQREAFMARWNQQHRGVYNSHRAAALSGDVDVKTVGNNDGKNLGFLESRIAMRDAALEHFGVPREIMGITENSNRATADSAQYIYAKNVLAPRIKSREEAINKQLLPLFGDNLLWRFDPVIPYDKEFDRTTALDAYNAGLITKNEARRLLDFDAVEGGDTWKASPTPTDALHTINPKGLPCENGEQKKQHREINVAFLLQQEEQAVQKNVPLFQSAVLQHFMEQRSAIYRLLGLDTRTIKFPSCAELDPYLSEDGTLRRELWDDLSEEEQIRVIEAAVSQTLDWEREAKKLLALLLPLWKQSYIDGENVSKTVYGLNVARPDFASAAKVNGARRIKGIEDATRRNIAEIIANGFTNGRSQAELADAIMVEMNTTKARANLIARQETTTAIATGEFDMMCAAGAKTKTWRHTPQENPRDGSHGQPNHVALDGETVAINERFSNGLRFPRDPEDGRAEEVINCRCYLTYSGF